MNDYIIISILLVLIVIVSTNYYNNLNKEEEQKFRNELVDIDEYFYSNEYILTSKRRKLWIHVPYEKNSRNWINFGSRTSYEINCSYIILCIKSIIDHCGDTFDIIIIDDTNFPDLLNTDIDILKLSGALKQKYRELSLLQVLNTYGGVIVPPSLFLHKSIKKIDNEKIWYVVELFNTTNVAYSNTFPSTLFTGSSKNNPELEKYINYYSNEIKNDFGEQSLHFNANYMRKNNIPYLDGKIIGVKNKYNNTIKLEDLMENKHIELCEQNIGLYIPHNELLKRKKYNWYCYLNFEEVLNCKVFISNYMLSKT
jgi:hypothetical protein